MLHQIPLGQCILQLVCTSALSGYGLYLSYHNITRLQQYEKQSEKAAEWSNTAAQRLHKTRTTQTSGTLSLLISFLSPLILLSTPYRSSSTIMISVGTANATMLFFTRAHMAAFWNESNQTRIPFMEKFNDAVRGSEKVVRVLGAASTSWGLSAAGWAAMGQGWI
ncbi:hypothetical protein GQ44DRAFT_717843 [Phaeosphaeriaceae sp. PMI808]|nr:hypothetical protein GQ44DRAFT_717843 [Phaeosphaeriaceae sp. PMI808]